MTEEEKRLEEYKLAASLFQSGFGLMTDIVRSFLLINSIVLGLWLLITRFSLDNDSDAHVIRLVLAIFGVLAGPGAIVIHMRMTRYYRSWLDRAAELEGSLGGKLFEQSRLIEFAGRDHFFQSYNVALALYFLFSMVWAIFLIVVLVRPAT